MIRLVQNSAAKNFPDRRSKFRTASLSLTLNIQGMFYAEFVGMFIAIQNFMCLPPIIKQLSLLHLKQYRIHAVFSLFYIL
jgi:hypothetical protein